MNFYLDQQRQEEIFADIIDISKPRKSYFLMICLSGIIASYGLLANSAAVVIGAMLIAPLMGPIFGIALSLTAGDKRLFKDSMISEILGAVLVIILAALIGLISLHPKFGSEIISRTQPNLYDILIALASGLAGAYALIDKRFSPMLAGVAIATALVPPAATCGLCISIGNWPWAFGAFLLFLSNLLSIEFAAAIVFFLARMFGKSEDIKLSFRSFIEILGFRLIIFAIITAITTTTLIRFVSEENFKYKMKTILSQEVPSVFGARLLNLQFVRHKDKVEVLADIVTPQEFDPDRVSKMQAKIQKQVKPKIHLIVRSLISRDTDEKGPYFISESRLENIEKSKENQEFINSASGIIKDGLKEQPGAQLVDITRDKTNGNDVIHALVRTPHKITPEIVAKIQASLNRELKIEAALIIQSTITFYADANEYLYEEEKAEKALVILKEEAENEEGLKEEALHKQVESILELKLTGKTGGVKIEKINYSRTDGKLEVTVEVITPKIVPNKRAKSLSEFIKRETGEENQLTIMSILGGSSSSTDKNSE